MKTAYPTRRSSDLTGDNTDNKEFAELDWFLTSLNGGTVVANTGAKDRYEGVQNSGADLYWNPESPMLDMYKKAGFPEIPDFFGRSEEHTSGLQSLMRISYAAVCLKKKTRKQ